VLSWSAFDGTLVAYDVHKRGTVVHSPLISDKILCAALASPDGKLAVTGSQLGLV
jgi:hypothetical protein